jgi:hypothetical protein
MIPIHQVSRLKRFITAAILVHETGHWLAGKMTGFRLILFAIGPWVISWNLGGWKTKWVRNRGYSGMCVMMPHQGLLRMARARIRPKCQEMGRTRHHSMPGLPDPGMCENGATAP